MLGTAESVFWAQSHSVWPITGLQHGTPDPCMYWATCNTYGAGYTLQRHLGLEASCPSGGGERAPWDCAWNCARNRGMEPGVSKILASAVALGTHSITPSSGEVGNTLHIAGVMISQQLASCQLSLEMTGASDVCPDTHPPFPWQGQSR